MYRTKSGITCVGVGFRFCELVKMAENWWRLESPFEIVECPLLLFSPLELHSIICETRERHRKLREVLNE